MNPRLIVVNGIVAALDAPYYLLLTPYSAALSCQSPALRAGRPRHYPIIGHHFGEPPNLSHPLMPVIEVCFVLFECSWPGCRLDEGRRGY